MIYYDKETGEIFEKPTEGAKRYPDIYRHLLPTNDDKIKQWRKLEKEWIDEQIELKSDSNKNAKATTMNDLRKYRNEVRDYETGVKPVRP